MHVGFHFSWAHTYEHLNRALASKGEEVRRGSTGGLGRRKDTSGSGRSRGLATEHGWTSGEAPEERVCTVSVEARLGGGVGEGQAMGDGGSFVSRMEWAPRGSQSGTSSETGKEETDPRLRGNPLGGSG